MSAAYFQIIQKKNFSNDKLVVGIQKFIVPFFQLFYTFDIFM